MTPEPEIWKPVLGYEMSYEVSNYGRVRSVGGKDRAGRFRAGRIRKAVSNGTTGHLFVRLYRDGIGKNIYVHRMVLEAFVGPRPAGMECRHYPDGSVGNNNLTNLSWGTRSENSHDKYTQGTKDIGESSSTAKLSEEQVKEIISKHISGKQTQSRLAVDYGVSQSLISRIIRKERWSHVA